MESEYLKHVTEERRNCIDYGSIDNNFDVSNNYGDNSRDILNKFEANKCTNTNQLSNNRITDRNKMMKPIKNTADALFFIFICFYILFLATGGLIFHYCEIPEEKSNFEKLVTLKMEFLEKYPQISDEDLTHFLIQVVSANKHLNSILHLVKNESNWDFGQALFFATTVVTAIGYGHITPLSQTGKIFCVIFATIGIPLTLVLLNAAVERLLIPTKWLQRKLSNKFDRLFGPINVRLLHFSIIVSAIGLLFFVIPTATFTYLEPSWNVFDAFYFCFISMTTIGLGDYVPGENHDANTKTIYKICITIYLVTGLIAMSSLTICHDIPQFNFGRFLSKTAMNDKLKNSMYKTDDTGLLKIGRSHFEKCEHPTRLEDQGNQVHILETNETLPLLYHNSQLS